MGNTLLIGDLTLFSVAIWRTDPGGQDHYKSFYERIRFLGRKEYLSLLLFSIFPQLAKFFRATLVNTISLLEFDEFICFLRVTAFLQHKEHRNGSYRVIRHHELHLFEVGMKLVTKQREKPLALGLTVARQSKTLWWFASKHSTRNHRLLHSTLIYTLRSLFPSIDCCNATYKEGWNLR